MQNLKGVINLFLALQDITWTEELIEQTSLRLKEAYRTLTLLKDDILYFSDTSDFLVESLHLRLSYIQSLYSYIVSSENDFTRKDSTVSFSTQCTERKRGEGPGRPSLDVTKEQIEYLRSMHFSWEKLAHLLQVSVSTLQRRRRAFGIVDQLEHYSEISDHDFDAIHKKLTEADANLSGGFLTSNIGRLSFIGALRSRGIRVQRWRVSQCLRRVDLIGTLLVLR